MSIREWTKYLVALDEKGDYWNSYTLFYTHIDNLYFYYKSESKQICAILNVDWQQNTEDLIDSLYKASEQLKFEIQAQHFDLQTYIFYALLIIAGTLCGFSR